jgi:hypothetical protein
LPEQKCDDLSFLPAPEAKYLWQATNQKQWEALYNHWLIEWQDGLYTQGEFCEITPGIRMNARAELWYEDVDDFGFLFVALIKEVTEVKEVPIWDLDHFEANISAT